MTRTVETGYVVHYFNFLYRYYYVDEIFYPLNTFNVLAILYASIIMYSTFCDAVQFVPTNTVFAQLSQWPMLQVYLFRTKDACKHG